MAEKSKKQKAKHNAFARTKKSKEHRGRGPIGIYLRTGIKNRACTGS